MHAHACMHAHTHTRAHIYIYIQACMHTHTPMHRKTHALTHTHTHVHACLRCQVWCERCSLYTWLRISCTWEIIFFFTHLWFPAHFRLIYWLIDCFFNCKSFVPSLAYYLHKRFLSDCDRKLHRYTRPYRHLTPEKRIMCGLLTCWFGCLSIVNVFGLSAGACWPGDLIFFFIVGLFSGGFRSVCTQNERKKERKKSLGINACRTANKLLAWRLILFRWNWRFFSVFVCQPFTVILRSWWNVTDSLFVTSCLLFISLWCFSGGAHGQICLRCGLCFRFLACLVLLYRFVLILKGTCSYIII